MLGYSFEAIYFWVLGYLYEFLWYLQAIQLEQVNSIPLYLFSKISRQALHVHNIVKFPHPSDF